MNVKLSGQLEAGQSLCGWIISPQMMAIAIMATDDHTFIPIHNECILLCITIIDIDTHHLRAYNRPT